MSTPPSPTMRQEWQLMVCDSESRVSKYSILRSSIRSGVACRPGSSGGCSGMGSNREGAVSSRSSWARAVLPKARNTIPANEAS
jgi:hypothetical protein